MGEMRYTHTSLVGKYERKYRILWKNYIKIVYKGIGWMDMDLINLAEIRCPWQADVSMAMKLHVP
jgi:hypothetical protein